MERNTKGDSTPRWWHAGDPNSEILGLRDLEHFSMELAIEYQEAGNVLFIGNGFKVGK